MVKLILWRMRAGRYSLINCYPCPHLSKSEGLQSVGMTHVRAGMSGREMLLSTDHNSSLPQELKMKDEIETGEKGVVGEGVKFLYFFHTIQI